MLLRELHIFYQYSVRKVNILILVTNYTKNLVVSLVIGTA